MRKVYERFEKQFEKVSEFVIHLFINSVVFALVLVLVSAWMVMVILGNESTIDKIGNCFIAVSFLTFFMVQRVLNKYNLALQVKLNELVRAHENASNELINVEKKSHKEIDDLAHELHSTGAADSRENGKGSIPPAMVKRLLE